MVLKFGKRGVRSGNTLKTPSVQFLRSYRKNAYIVRKDTNANGDDITSEMFGVEDLQLTGIPYSLNKKGRWLFPPKLINAVKQGDFHFKDYGVQLFEKHNITNENTNCVSAYFSRGPIKEATVYKLSGKRKRRRTGYMCGHVQKKKNLYLPERNNKRLKQCLIPVRQDKRAINSVENSQITFEVVYPSPITSSLTHNPKHIGYYPDKTKQSSKYHTMRRINQDIIQVDTSNMDHEQEKSDGEPKLHGIHHEPKEKLREQIDLLTFITHAVGRKRLTRKSSDDLLTDVVPKLEQTVSAESVASNDHFVRVIIAHTETHPNTLATLYGSSFIECDCFPRKFIIDISTDLQALEVFKLHWKENIKPVHAFVVFVHDFENEINTQSDQVYKVYLNSSFTNDMSTPRIETIFDYTETNIAECLNNSLFYIETLPNLVQTQEYGVSSGKIYKELHVEQFLDWSNNIYLPDDQLMKELSLATGQNADTIISFDNLSSCPNTADSGPHLSGTKNEHLCAICYTDIGFDAPGTALRKCGHWFCNQCWEAHLTTQVKGGSIVMECPQFSCKTPVDRGTMMSLLCLRDILKHTKACHDMDIDRHEETKWCPNNKCGRVLQVHSSDVPLINCDCGQRVCFKCLGEVHWPASCQSVMSFRQLFQETGVEDDVQALIAVNGMNCPHCKRFFEKIDGCPYMHCLCTKSFCWGCGRDWFKFTHDNRCNEIGQNIVHMGTKSMLIFSDDNTKTKKNEWISTAVLHREKKDVVKVRTPHLKKFAKELISYMNKSSHIPAICLDFKGSSVGYTAESHKVREFLAHLTDIKFELHFIAENIAILLSLDVSLSLSQRIYFTNLIQKFEHNCTILEECFSSTVVHSDKQQLIRKMKMFRSNSLQLIKSTAHHVKMLKL